MEPLDLIQEDPGFGSLKPTPDSPESRRAPCTLADLPPEIMSIVFEFCLPFPVMPVPSKAPLLLGQVCGRWREIALSTPQLWNTIHLHDPYSSGICSLLEVWLARALACGLTIALTWSRVDWRSMAVWNTVIQFSDHWKRITLDLPYHELERLKFLLKGRFASVERLFLTVRSPAPRRVDPFHPFFASIPSFDDTLSIFEDATRLKTFNWTNVPYRPLSLRLPCSGLEHVVLAGIADHQC
ncbi:hypothetical protein DFH07DRAFT_342671 [Mycena maculata]|uniref:F-box domain-containing protein n=1 Tax=Mycena maculata TaxID=230809 RepID=A0AAD7NLQ0_9AGAR|nr:hypothetical protein DFH07DRAFT_342671 [Mycena maculata]